jgi:hypothetical protein
MPSGSKKKNETTCMTILAKESSLNIFTKKHMCHGGKLFK